MGFCSCIPPPASVQPRKTYNVLVPDVFGANIGPPPKLDSPIPTSTARKIGKLQEYVQKNPSKAAKVSRRLTRRIKKALIEHALGDVKVAVHAYKQLLNDSTAHDSSYTFSYFTKELIQQPDAVILTLLNYNHKTIQSLGAQLLGSYIAAQSEIESQPDVNATLVGVACKIAASACQKEQQQQQQQQGGGGLASLDLESLQVSCLGAMREYVILCRKLRILPSMLDEIEVSILDIIENDEHGKAWLLEQADAKMREPSSTLTKAPSANSSAKMSVSGSGNSFMNKLSSLRKENPFQRTSKDDHKGGHPKEGDSPAKAGNAPQAGCKTEPQRPVDVALDVLSSYRPFLRVISTVRRVMDTLLRWLDQNNRWDRKELVEGLLALVQSFAGDLTFPLTACLMRHCATPSAIQSLTPHQRAIVVRLAALQGMAYSLSALSLALSELPKALVLQAADTRTEGKAVLEDAVHSAVRQLAVEVGDAEQVCEAVGQVLRGSNVGQPKPASDPASAALEAGNLRLYTLQCGLTVVRTIPSFAGRGCAFSGSVLPPTLLRALAEICSSTAPSTARAAASASAQTQQQLWQLQQQQGQVTAKLLQGMLAPLGGSALRDERQAVLLLQLAGQWLGLLGAPPLPGSTFSDSSAVLATSGVHGDRQQVDSNDIHISVTGAGTTASSVSGPAMVSPPAFELASQLAAVAMTCSRGTGAALSGARLAVHAHLAALLVQPPFPMDLSEPAGVDRNRSVNSHNDSSLFLPNPPPAGTTPKADIANEDDEPCTPNEEFGTAGSNIQSPASSFADAGSEFFTPSSSSFKSSAYKGKSGPLTRGSQQADIPMEPAAEAAVAKWRAGLLVLADVLLVQLSACTQCSGLSGIEVKDARDLTPELKLVPPKPGSHTQMSATSQTWSSSSSVVTQLNSVVAGLQTGGLSWWLDKALAKLCEAGNVLADTYGKAGLLQQLHAPLEASSSCDADVACSSWLARGISREGSSAVVDSSITDSLTNGDSSRANGALPGWAGGKSYNPPVSIVKNVLVDDVESEDY